MAALPPTMGESPTETGREAIQVDEDGFASSVEEDQPEDREQAAVQGLGTNVQFQVVSENEGVDEDDDCAQARSRTGHKSRPRTLHEAEMIHSPIKSPKK